MSGNNWNVLSTDEWIKKKCKDYDFSAKSSKCPRIQKQPIQTQKSWNLKQQGGTQIMQEEEELRVE